MSANYKNTNNYSALINEIKATTLNDKIKGRNHKLFLKRNQSQGGDKSIENLPLKTVMNTTNTTNPEINQKYASIDLRSLEKKKILNGINPIINEYNSNQIDPLKRRNQSISGLTNHNSTNVGNKIDIKISVNYNKPNISNPVNMANPNSQLSSGLSSSKSFYQTASNNMQNNNSLNSINQINTLNLFNSKNHRSNNHNINYNHNHYSNNNINHTAFITPNDNELIKNKINTSKQNDTNLNASSSISEEKFKEKLNEHRSHLGKTSLASSAFGLNHLRNRSQNLLDQNNLNISLMGYENKNLKNYLINHSQMNMNMSINNLNNYNNTTNINNSTHGHGYNSTSNNSINNKLVFSHYKYPSVDKSENQSFSLNNKLYNYIHNNPNSQKKVGGDINKIINISQNNKNSETVLQKHNVTSENIDHPETVISNVVNMKDFTLNRNNDELMQVVDTVETQHNMENDNVMDINKFLILETNLEDHLSNLKFENESKEKSTANATPNSNLHNNLILYVLNKKFMIYQKTFEEYLNLLQAEKTNKNLLQKLFQGYNEVINNLITHQSEKMSEHENIATSKIFIIIK
jgi:hypothetical protein